MKSLVRVALLLLLGFVLFTWWALESSGVATHETMQPDGTISDAAETDPYPT